MNLSVHAITKMNRRPHRRGLSLVELLIVMAVVLLLAGLTLPSFRSMLQDQRVSQTARVVHGMAESARARAIALGRPVALVLDRTPVDPSASSTYNVVSDNTCTRMSIGEVFPPYEGDWAGATGDLLDLMGGDGIPDTLSIDLAKVSSLIDMSTNQPNGLIEVGDLLQLSDHSQLFSISGLAVAGNSPNFKVNVSFSNPPPGFSSAEPLWSTLASGIRFRMIRRPSKTMAGSTPMPRGMCIDLSQSGIGVSGAELAAAARVGATAADLYGPIFIVFNARGNVDGIYYRQHSGGSYTFAAIGPTGVLHMLVGRTEQVALDGSTIISGRDSAVPNLFDARNVWVSINPFSGAIYSTPNAAPSVTPTPSIAAASDRMAARAFAINVLDARGS